MKINLRTLLQLLLVLVIFSGSADAVTITPIKCNATAPAPSNTAEWLNINLESFIPNASCWMNNTYHTISTFGLFNIMAKFGTLVIIIFTFKAFFDGWVSRNWTGTLRVLFLSAIAVVLLNDAKHNNSITNRIYTIPVNLWRTIYKASSGMVQDSVKQNVVKNTQELATVTGAFVLNSMLATNSMITYNLDGKTTFQQAAAGKDGTELAGLTDAAANKAMGEIKDVNKEMTEQVKKMSFIFQIGYLFLMGFFMAFAGIIYFSGLTIIICMFAFPLAVAFWAVGNSRPLTTIFNTVLVSLATVAIVPVVMAVAANLAIAQPTATIKTQMATANNQANKVVTDYIAKSVTCAAQGKMAGSAAPVGSQTVVNAATQLKCETLDQITPIAKEFGASVFRITIAMVVMIMTMLMCIGIGVAMMRHVPSLLSQIFQGGTVSADSNNVSAIAGAGVAGAIAGGQRAVGYTIAGAQGVVTGTKNLAGGLNEAGAGVTARAADALGGGSKNPKLGDGGAFALPSPAPTPTLPGGAGGAAAVNSTASNNATPAPSAQAANQATGTTASSSTAALPGAVTAAGQGTGQDGAAGNVTSAAPQTSNGITVTSQSGPGDVQTGPTAVAVTTGGPSDMALASSQDVTESSPAPQDADASDVQATAPAQAGDGAEDLTTSLPGDVTGDVIAPPADAASAPSDGAAAAPTGTADAAPMTEALHDGDQVAAVQDNTVSVAQATGETITPEQDETDQRAEAEGAVASGGAADLGGDSASTDASDAGVTTAALAAETAATLAANGAAAGAAPTLNAAGQAAAANPGSIAAGKYTQALKDQQAKQDQAAAARMSTTATGIIGLATRDKLGLSAGQNLAVGIAAKGLKHGTQGVRDTAAAGQRLAARGEAITPKTLAAEKAAMRREGALPSQRQADTAAVKSAAIAHNRAELAQAAKDSSYTPNLITPDQARHALATSGQLPSQISADKARIDQVMADHKQAQAQLDRGDRTPMSRDDAQAQLASQGQLSAQQYQSSPDAQGMQAQGTAPSASTGNEEGADHTVELRTPQTAFAEDAEPVDTDHSGGQAEGEQDGAQATSDTSPTGEAPEDTALTDDAGSTDLHEDRASAAAAETQSAGQSIPAEQAMATGQDESSGADRSSPADGQVDTQISADPARTSTPEAAEATSRPAASAASASTPVQTAPGQQDGREPMPVITTPAAVPVAAAVRGAQSAQNSTQSTTRSAERRATPRQDQSGQRTGGAPRSGATSGGRSGARQTAEAPAGPLKLNKAGQAAERGERTPAPAPQVGKYTAALQASRAKAQEQRDANKPLTATRIIGMAARDNRERVANAVNRFSGQLSQGTRDRLDARADRSAVRREVQADYDRRTAAVAAQVEQGVSGAADIKIVKRSEQEMHQEMQRTGTLPSQVRAQKAQSQKAQELTSTPAAFARDRVAAARQGADYDQLKRDGGLPSQVQADREAVHEVTRAHNAAEVRRAASATQKGEVYVPQTVTADQVRDHMAHTGTLPSHQSVNEARIEHRTAQLTEQHARALENDPQRARPHLDRDTVHRILEEEKGLAHQAYQARQAAAPAAPPEAHHTHDSSRAAPERPAVAQPVTTGETVTAPQPSSERIPVPHLPAAEAMPVSSAPRTAPTAQGHTATQETPASEGPASTTRSDQSG